MFYIMPFTIFIPGIQPKTMNNDLPNLNGFPTDNSPSTQLKYNIVASKFMTGIENHQKRNAPAPVISFGLISALVQGIIALIVIVFIGLRWVLKEILKRQS